jgi:AcrR family transcriptional regulator
MGRRNEHSREELKALALRAAGDIVAESGAAALSMREVARRIGYTVGALYIVFTNLDDLIVHLNEQTILELRTALERIRGRANQPAQNLRLLVAAYLGFALAPGVRTSASRRAEGAVHLRRTYGCNLRAGWRPAARGGHYQRHCVDRRSGHRVVEWRSRHLHACGHRQVAGRDAGVSATPARRVAR